MSHIYDELRAAGVPLDHHESDLYAKVLPESKAIVRRHLDAGSLRSAPLLFTSQIDGDLWYDLAFMYRSWWEGKLKP